MLKWAAIFFGVMIIAGIFGFVIDVAGWIAKALFLVCLAGFAISLVLNRSKKAPD